MFFLLCFFFQAEDGIRDRVRSRGLGDVYKRQVLARLRGHEEPEIFMKNPNAIKIGGGQDPFNGDFDYDSVEYKVRHVCGAAVADYRGSYASTGAA